MLALKDLGFGPQGIRAWGFGILWLGFLVSGSSL